MSRLTSLKLATVSLSHGTLPDYLPSVTLSTILEFVYRGSREDLDFLFLSQLTFTEKSLRFTFDTNVPSFQRLPSTFPTDNLILSLITDILTVTNEITELHLDFGSDTFTLGTPLVHFGVRCPTITMIYDRYISWMSASFPLFANLEEIYLSGTIIPEFWSILVKMDYLVLIQINSEQSCILFNLLVENWHHINPTGVMPNDRPELLLPRLLSISVEQTGFQNVQDELFDALMYRCFRKKGLSFLGIKDCSGIRAGFMDRLRMAIIDVDWDGVGELDADDDEDNEGDDDDEEDEEEEEEEEEEIGESEADEDE
ncbi:hypothetical protein BDN72DRAFT_897978 [Pluteus cervinus]|uniref:Uncharacterized protein n=1 Tax=Pluteus cervinus TaxID=181527 RepID=A0ACD3AUJ9_9AGAR|nr:hypothetical protein BDN72DRAFT_897978 [Pluteus cervinus]